MTNPWDDVPFPGDEDGLALPAAAPAPPQVEGPPTDTAAKAAAVAAAVATWRAALAAGKSPEEAARVIVSADDAMNGKATARGADPALVREARVRRMADSARMAEEAPNPAAVAEAWADLAKGARDLAAAGKAADHWQGWGNLAGLYGGDPPPVEWVVHQTFARGISAILAADGAVGKTWLALDLALTVAGGKHASAPNVLGYGVHAEGPAVVLTAEDGKDTIWRRLKVLDPTGERRRKAQGRLFILPGPNLPDFARPTPIGYEDRKAADAERFKMGEAFDRFADWLETFKPALVVLDPLAALSHLDGNDNAAGGFIMHKLNGLAQRLNCLVLMTHHMRKDMSDGLRAGVRGAGALVNESRAVLALAPFPMSNPVVRSFLEELPGSLDPKGWQPATGDAAGLFLARLVKVNELAHTGNRVFARGTDARLYNVTDLWREHLRANNGPNVGDLFTIMEESPPPPKMKQTTTASNAETKPAGNTETSAREQAAAAAAALASKRLPS